jgi:hypothetical protein
MSAQPSESSDSLESVTVAIERRADSYVELVEKVRADPGLRAGEAGLLDQFERYTAGLLDRYQPARLHYRDSLAFARLYERMPASEDERPHVVLGALMAAEVESLGPLRLTQAQNIRLAAILERIGRDCAADGLPLHASRAFDRAAGIYLLLSDNHARDRCLFARTRYRHKASGRGLPKAFLFLSWILCGYGYKPYRLLLWVAVQVVAFTLAIALITPSAIGDGVYLSLINYLDPQTPDRLPTTIKALLVAENYLGIISLSVFFALLVHRWFRI